MQGLQTSMALEAVKLQLVPFVHELGFRRLLSLPYSSAYSWAKDCRSIRRFLPLP